MNETTVGIVKWFNNEIGFGFIIPEDDISSEYFVHYTSIETEGFKTIQAGQKVQFELLETPKGIQAVNVKPML